MFLPRINPDDPGYTKSYFPSFVQPLLSGSIRVHPGLIFLCLIPCLSFAEPFPGALSVAEIASPTATAVPGLPEVVITGTRLKNPASRIPQTFSTMDQKDLAIWADKPLGDVLEGLPGASYSVNGNGFSGAKSSLSIRSWGMGGEVLIARDGRRLSNDTDGEGFDLSLIDMASIERVELFRGSSSALFGSGAHAGVANLVTRRPTGTRTVFEGLGGTEGYLRSSLQTEGKGQAWEYRFTASWTQQGDQRTPDHGLLVNSAFHRSNASLFLAYLLSPSQELTLDGQMGHGWDDGFPGDLYAPVSNDKNLWDDRGYAKLSYRQDWDGGGLSVTYDQGLKGRQTHRERTSGVTVITIDQFQQTRSYGAAAVFDGTLGGHHAVVGTEGFFEDHWGYGSIVQEASGGATTYNAPKLPRSDVWNGALFLQDEWSGWGGLLLTLGARYDAYSIDHRAFLGDIFPTEAQAHNAFTLHLGALYPLSDSFRVKASAGNSFVMPNVVQLYTFDPRTGFALLGNPALKPATGRSLDLGIVYEGKEVKAELTGFLSDLEGRQVLGVLLRDGSGTFFNDLNGEFGFPDLLDDPALVGAPTNKWFYHYNLGRMRNDGLEGSLVWKVGGGFQVTGSFSWNITMRELSTGDWIPTIPPYTGRTSLGWEGEGFGITLLGRLGGGYDTQSRTRPGLPIVLKEGYFVLDLSARKTLSEDVSLLFSASNLLDTPWQQTLDVPESGFAWRTGIQLSL